MKRFALIVGILVAVIALLYPLDGIWLPGQISSATIDGQPVGQDQLGTLYWDLQRSRLGDAPSKCLGWVELQLRNGTQRQFRLSQSIAVTRWMPTC